MALGSSDEEEEPSWLGWQLCNFFGRLWFGSSVLGFVLWLMPYVWGSRVIHLLPLLLVLADYDWSQWYGDYDIDALIATAALGAAPLGVLVGLRVALRFGLWFSRNVVQLFTRS